MTQTVAREIASEPFTRISCHYPVEAEPERRAMAEMRYLLLATLACQEIAALGSFVNNSKASA
jgi:hypothetical protein